MFRRFVVLALVVCTMVGCGGAPPIVSTSTADAPPTAAATAAPSATAAEVATSAPTTTTATETATSAPAAEDATPGNGSTHVVKHALGESVVPAAPQRVVVLDAMDDVLALGIKPVAVANWIGTLSGESAAFPSYLDAQTVEGIVWLGDNKQPSLEKIVAAKPDLILGRTTWHEDIYAELSSIAPTVIVDQKALGGWKGQFLAYADALNRTSQAQTLLDAYEQRAAALKARLDAAPVVQEVSLVRFDPDRIVIYEKGIFAGSVLADAGVRRPAGQDGDQTSDEISLEELPRIDSDVLISLQANADESILATLKGNPLWAQLKAVQTAQVYDVDFDVWVGGWTITGANMILDDLERILKLQAS